MDVFTMTVGSETEKPHGATCNAVKPYEFIAYAGTNRNTAENWRVVKIVMPLGGAESGLFRYPIPGETVLVTAADASSNTVPHYLMGYLPGNNQKFSPGGTGTVTDLTQAEVIERKGQVFRYKNTAAKNTDTNKYSEIGFYQKFKGESRISDELQITSAGSAVQKTEKEHALHAHGIEMLSGLNPDTVNESGEEKELAVGDAVGETYALGDTDIQIRAGGQVVIKAAKKIVLQVGRSRITIDDTGINLITKKINSNWVNTFDTSLNLNARNGITMFGQSVGISGGRSVTLGDSYGGAFGSSAGVVSVTGREISLNTLDVWGYASLLTLNAIDLGFNTAAVSLAKNGDDPTFRVHADKVKTSYDFIKKTANFFFKIAKLHVKIKKAWKKEEQNFVALYKRVNKLLADGKRDEAEFLVQVANARVEVLAEREAAAAAARAAAQPQADGAAPQQAVVEPPQQAVDGAAEPDDVQQE